MHMDYLDAVMKESLDFFGNFVVAWSLKNRMPQPERH